MRECINLKRKLKNNYKPEEMTSGFSLFLARIIDIKTYIYKYVFISIIWVFNFFVKANKK